MFSGCYVSALFSFFFFSVCLYVLNKHVIMCSGLYYMFTLFASRLLGILAKHRFLLLFCLVFCLIILLPEAILSLVSMTPPAVVPFFILSSTPSVLFFPSGVLNARHPSTCFNLYPLYNFWSVIFDHILKLKRFVIL